VSSFKLLPSREKILLSDIFEDVYVRAQKQQKGKAWNGYKMKKQNLYEGQRGFGVSV
jgi:hypothetical protein